MKLLNSYNLIHDLKEEIGDDCSVTVYVSEDILNVHIIWENRFHYKRCFSRTELEVSTNDDFLIKTLIYEANRSYKLYTIGEE